MESASRGGLLRCETPLGLFASLWALGAALHHLETDPLGGLCLYPFVIMLWIFPESPWALAIFAGVHASLLFLSLPAVSNHSVLALLVDVCLLLGVASMGAGGEARSRRIWESVRGPLRATVLIVYFWAVFDKLNTDFLDPRVSCATDIAGSIFTIHGLPRPALPAGVWALAIPLSLVVESAIPICLLLPGGRRAGTILGLVFHTWLGWAQFYDFATVVFALYLFFVPWNAIQRYIRGAARWLGVSCIVATAVLCATSFGAHALRGDPILVTGAGWHLEAQTVQCACWTIIVWTLLFPLFVQRRRREDEDEASGSASTALTWTVPLIALFNGVTPYLGLKTVSNYSMFSNLRTGEHTNHLLVRTRRLFVAPYQDDLVRVVFLHGTPPRSHPFWLGHRDWISRYARWIDEMPDVRLPFFEVQRTLQWWRAVGFEHVAIVYEQGGVQHDIADAFGDPVLMRPLAPWQRLFLAFRAVQADGAPEVCRW